MKTTRLLASVLGLCIVIPAWTTDKADFSRVPSAGYTHELHEGMRAYNRKDYEQAFALLRRAACAGDKTSQAMVSRMYILGHGTHKDDLKGYAWIRTAAEFRFRDFTSLAHRLEQALTPEQRTTGNALANEYRKRYGLVATHMDCQGEARPGAKIVDRVICAPENAGGAVVWVHRCVDDTEP